MPLDNLYGICKERERTYRVLLVSDSPLYLQGAIQCIESMSPNDEIGLVVFNVTAYLQSPLVKGTEENKALLSRTVSGFSTYWGTYYTDAIKMARAELKKSNADIAIRKLRWKDLRNYLLRWKK